MSVARNDPCPCGSGKKYKKCCMGADKEKRRQHNAMLRNVALGVAVVSVFVYLGYGAGPSAVVAALGFILLLGYTLITPHMS